MSDAIRRKINSLLRMADPKYNATPAERDTAKRIAQKLIDAHGAPEPPKPQTGYDLIYQGVFSFNSGTTTTGGGFW